jgi:hypothetical protein
MPPTTRSLSTSVGTAAASPDDETIVPETAASTPRRVRSAESTKGSDYGPDTGDIPSQFPGNILNVESLASRRQSVNTGTSRSESSNERPGPILGFQATSPKSRGTLAEAIAEFLEKDDSAEEDDVTGLISADLQPYVKYIQSDGSDMKAFSSRQAMIGTQVSLTDKGLSTRTAHYSSNNRLTP